MKEEKNKITPKIIKTIYKKFVPLSFILPLYSV